MHVIYLIKHGKEKKVKSLRFVCSQLFCDFGEEFEVLDKDGETPASAIIQGITKVNTFFGFMLLAAEESQTNLVICIRTCSTCGVTFIQ